MIPPSFEYHAPTVLQDALGLLRQHGEGARVLAGGHSLLPMMKLRFAEPEHLIDLNRIDALRGVREDGAHVVIGAMTTENELIASELLQRKCPLIPEAARQIADPQVRNCGTVGGDIAHGDPANDHPAIMLTLGADFVLAQANGERTVAADGFFV
ncbi:MAG TPA: FAD binding domain-containing protein, partial [Gammaproteobacteria bacterium]